jgi:hypothetical protein
MQDQQPFESICIVFALPNPKELNKRLNRRTAKLKLTKLEKTALLEAVNEQAVATAKLWDVLRELELKYDIEFEADARRISEIAVSCDCPPCVEDLRGLTLADVLGLLPFRVVRPSNPRE